MILLRQCSKSMTFQVEITAIAETQIEQAYQWYRERNPEFGDRWFRSLMNAIRDLHSNKVPVGCASLLAPQIPQNWGTSEPFKVPQFWGI